MSDEPLQNVGNYPYEGVAPSNAVPPVPCSHTGVHQACTVGHVYTEYLFALGAQRWRLSQIPATSDTYRDYTFPTPPATYAPYGASRPIYPQYYERPPAVSMFT